jgi:hypothetical protein
MCQVGNQIKPGGKWRRLKVIVGKIEFFKEREMKNVG